MGYKNIEKQKEAQHKSYLKNRDKYRKATISLRSERRKYINDLKSVPCADCKVVFPYYVMDFDHRDSAEKFGNISEMIMFYGWSKILEEIKKCDVVCSNCHRIRTYNRRHAL